MSRIWLTLALVILYLPGLGSVGFLGPDEPRYASIGREVGRSGDWITPRLDGQPWFEKPPLLYWMVALGRAVHLPDEWAARLPMVLASVAFLIFFFTIVQREFSSRTAFAATAILATSAGWMAYSFAALTDLPMTVTLASALLLAIFDTRLGKTSYLAGGLLGLSILAKGLVPLVLFVPALLIARGRRLAILAGCLIVATPWYVLCWIRNGPAFWDELFWKQHVSRFLSPAIEHVQPFWFYLPILLAGLFPWTPLAGLLFSSKTYRDVRVRFLMAWVIFGLIFFSASMNKLPGYVLPLMPALAIILAVGLEKAKQAHWWLAASTLLLTAVPVVAAVLPGALMFGLRRAMPDFTPGFPLVLATIILVGAAAIVGWLGWRYRPGAAVVAATAAAALAILYLKVETLPVLDQRVSVRAFWRANQGSVTGALGDACLKDVNRPWEYGLNYYAGHALAQCAADDSAERARITVRNGKLELESSTLTAAQQ